MQAKSPDIDPIDEVEEEEDPAGEKPVKEDPAGEEKQDDKPETKPDKESVDDVKDLDVIDEPEPSQTVAFDPWKDFKENEALQENVDSSD